MSKELVVYSIDHRCYLYIVRVRLRGGNSPVKQPRRTSRGGGEFPVCMRSRRGEAPTYEKNVWLGFDEGNPRRRLRSPLREDICNTPP